jgi:putative hemolysin
MVVVDAAMQEGMWVVAVVMGRFRVMAGCGSFSLRVANHRLHCRSFSLRVAKLRSHCR